MLNYIMANINGNFKPNVGRFAATSEQEIEKLMEERGAKNTNKQIEGVIRLLKQFLVEKNYLELEALNKDILPDILKDFYTNVHTKNGECYHLQSLRNMRSNLNRWFQENMDLNIITDPLFSSANIRFKAMQVNTKKIGKAVTKKTEKISDEDMQKLGNYFNVDHMNCPNPAVLKRSAMKTCKSLETTLM